MSEIPGPVLGHDHGEISLGLEGSSKPPALVRLKYAKMIRTHSRIDMLGSRGDHRLWLLPVVIDTDSMPGNPLEALQP